MWVRGRQNSAFLEVDGIRSIEDLVNSNPPEEPLSRKQSSLGLSISFFKLGNGLLNLSQLQLEGTKGIRIPLPKKVLQGIELGRENLKGASHRVVGNKTFDLLNYRLHIIRTCNCAQNETVSKDNGKREQSEKEAEHSKNRYELSAK